MKASDRLAQHPRSKKSVDTGPIIPACDAVAAPMRSTAIMVRNTGNTVQKNALIIDKLYTSIGCISMEAGRIIKNCAMHATLDMHIAYATNATQRRALRSKIRGSQRCPFLELQIS